jgi:zinc transporter ZupT
MTPSQLSDFTDEVTKYQIFHRPSKELIAFFKGTAAEPILRQKRHKINILIPIAFVGLILPIGFGIVTAFKIAALSQSPLLGLLGGLIVGWLLWLVVTRIFSKLE